MLERPCLDERCASTYPTRVANYRSLNAEKEDGKKSPQTEPCHFQNLRNVSNEPCQPSDVLKAKICRDGQSEKAPRYFPQPGDNLPARPEGPMLPIGPWATGRVEFSPESGMVGVRPVVDRYSITRYNPPQWRAHNRTFFDESSARIAEAQSLASRTRQVRAEIYRETDCHQLENRDRLSERASVLYGWRMNLERCLAEITDEIELLESERRRIKQSLSALCIPEAIAGDFLQLRSCRLEPDLVRDTVEDELVKEAALCAEIRRSFEGIRERIENQLGELKAAKARIEFDFTDKKDAFEIDSFCTSLTNESSLIMLKPGATRVPAEQSTPAGHEHFSKDTLEACHRAKQNSVGLRASLDSIYENVVRDLRSQAMIVDSALAEQIHITQEICQELEAELVRCLAQLSNTENLIEELRGSAKKVNDALRVAQTRLGSRLERRNVESCRDVPQYGLIEEVKALGDSLAKIAKQLRDAEDAQAALVKVRNDLEYEIIVKKKSLYVDRDRGQSLRSFYPTAQELAGHV